MKKFAFFTVGLIFFALFSLKALNSNEDEVIIDSMMSFDEAITGTKAPREIIDSLVMLDVEYYSFDKKLHRGQIVVNKRVADDVRNLFELIKSSKFPVVKVIPIVKYDWSDSASMADNNTSAFNYRTIAGTKKMSLHSYGRAIDINPLTNPFVSKDGTTSPPNAKYSAKNKGTLTGKSKVVEFMKESGWRWGGEFVSYKDYQHFDIE